MKAAAHEGGRTAQSVKTFLWEMLGLAYFYTGRKEEAREEFIALLYMRPKYRLDTFLVPPPAVRFFDEIWKNPQMKDRLEQIERERIAAQRG